MGPSGGVGCGLNSFFSCFGRVSRSLMTYVSGVSVCFKSTREYANQSLRKRKFCISIYHMVVYIIHLAKTHLLHTMLFSCAQSAFDGYFWWLLGVMLLSCIT